MSAPEIIDLTQLVFEVNVYGANTDRVKRIVLTPIQKKVPALPGATVEFRVTKVIREDVESL